MSKIERTTLPIHASRGIRRVLAAAFTVASCIGPASSALAQAWPTKPVRIVVAFPPGGIADFSARAIGPGLSEMFRQPVVIENRSGASGTIGAGVVAQAAPDGYTLLAHTISFSSAPHMQGNLSFDPLTDLVPVTQIMDSPNILVVNPAMPVKSVKDLTALATKRRGELSYASSGTGSGTHLSGELYKSVANLDIVHIAYKGGGPAVADLVGGHVPMMFSTLPSVLGHVRAGRLRALAVTGNKRFPTIPDVPTMAEAGATGYSFSGWSGLFAPRGTPRPVIDRVASDTAKVLADPELRKRLLNQGAEAVGSTPDEFAAFFRSEFARWGKMIRDNNLAPKK